MARLLKLNELNGYKTEDYLLWREVKDKDAFIPCPIDSPAQKIYCEFVEAISGTRYVNFGGIWMEAEEYGKTWRCWEGKPTEEQMKETKWEDEEEIVELIIPMYKNKVTTLDLESASGEIIRCKDCKYFDNERCWKNSISRPRDYDWFCADGEIKRE